MLNTGDLDLEGTAAIVDRFFAGNGAPGLAFGVVVDGVLVHQGGRGVRRVALPDAQVPDPQVPDAQVPDADTVFRIASMTKSFTATAVLSLRDDGLLSLEDPVASWVPEAAGMGLATADSAPVTVRQLLTMTGGLPTDDPWGDRQQNLPADEFGALLSGGLRMAWPNGTTFEYSNLGYALLGRVVAAVGGEEYRRAMLRRVLGPLAMSSTVYSADGVSPERLATGHRYVDDAWVPLPFDAYGAFAPMGGLFSTVRDLARWIGTFTDAFPARDDAELPASAGGHPLRRASRREMQQPHRAVLSPPSWTSIDTAPQFRSAAYGFGLFIEQDQQLGPVVGHSGGYPGFGSHMRWHPDSGVGVVVLANSTYAQAPRLGAQLLSALLAGAPSPEVARARIVSPPRSGALWPETVAAQRDVERLIAAWDDEVASRVFAMNVDLDDALTRRATLLHRMGHALGPFSRDPDAPTTSESPSHLAWWMRGARGRLKVEIRLSPELPPRVQTFTLTPVPDPPPALRDAAEAVVAMFGADDPRWPQGVRAAAALDVAGLTSLVRVASGWAGASQVVAAIGGNGTTEATFEVAGARCGLVLALGVDAGSGEVVRLTIRPAG